MLLDVPELDNICWSPGLKSLKLCKGRSGSVKSFMILGVKEVKKEEEEEKKEEEEKDKAKYLSENGSESIS